MLIIGTLWRFDVTGRSIDFDEGLFLYTADRVERGVAEYTDDFDNMPPGIYYLYILSFKIFGNSPTAPHMVSVISDLGIIGLLIALGWILGGKIAGMASGGLYAFCYVMLRWAPKGSTENPMTFLLLASVLFYFWAIREPFKPRPAMLFLAGILVGAAAMIKQPAVFLWLTFAGHQFYISKWGKTGIKGALRTLILIFCGFLTTLVLVALTLWGKGILEQGVFNGFVFPFLFQNEYGMTFWQKWDKFITKGLMMMPGFSLLGFIGIGVLVIGHDQKRIFPFLWSVPVLIFFAWTGDLYQHYFIQLAPGLALGAGLFIALLFSQEEKWLLKCFVILCLALFICGNHVRISQSYINNSNYRSRLFPTEKWLTLEDQRLDYQKMVGKYISMNLKPGQKIVATTPTYAYLAGVPNSYRFFYLAPLTRAASKNNFADLTDAVFDARYFIIEESRIEYIGSRLYESVKTKWTLVKTISEPEQYLQVWENPAFVNSP